MRKMNKLGKGLGALLGEEAGESEITSIPVHLIHSNPHQPRAFFDEKALEELSESIKKHGVVQPVIIRKTGQEYELIAGERRLRASKMAGLEEIPVIVREYNDSESAEIALVENLQREDLNPVEEGIAYEQLMNQFQLTQEKAAEMVGKSRSYVANMLRILALPEEVKTLLSEKKISVGQARPLLALKNPAEQIHLAKRIAEEGLSARQVEQMTSPREAMKKKEEPGGERVFYQSIEEKLKLSIGTPVRIKLGSKKKNGIIEISFYGDDEFQRLIRFLENSDRME